MAPATPDCSSAAPDFSLESAPLPGAAPSTAAQATHLGGAARSGAAPSAAGQASHLGGSARPSASSSFTDLSRAARSPAAFLVDLPSLSQSPTSSTSHRHHPENSFSQSLWLAQGALNDKEEKRQRIKERNRAYQQRMVLHTHNIPHDPMLPGLFDHVFIDKKCYGIARKNYISDVMILAAVARPRFGSDGTCTFDGKIGCFPLVSYEVAKRSNANRHVGTIEMKPINPVTEEVIRHFMIQMVLPAIRAKWPPEDANKAIFIQQDSGRPHLAPNDKLLSEAGKQHGFDMRVACQPSNSPNFNIHDLGLFNSIQSIQYKTVEDLVAAVLQDYEGYSVQHANRYLLRLHGCIKRVMKDKGVSFATDM